jgi:hypothetical protein
LSNAFQRSKKVHAEHFFSEGSVKTFDVSILSRFSGLNEL